MTPEEWTLFIHADTQRHVQDRLRTREEALKKEHDAHAAHLRELEEQYQARRQASWDAKASATHGPAPPLPSSDIPCPHPCTLPPHVPPTSSTSPDASRRPTAAPLTCTVPSRCAATTPRCPGTHRAPQWPPTTSAPCPQVRQPLTTLPDAPQPTPLCRRHTRRTPRRPTPPDVSQCRPAVPQQRAGPPMTRCTPSHVQPPFPTRPDPQRRRKLTHRCTPAPFSRTSASSMRHHPADVSCTSPTCSSPSHGPRHAR